MCHTQLIASDVWAYGVFCWEVFTLGDEPFPQYTNDGVAKHILAGLRLTRPDRFPEPL